MTTASGAEGPESANTTSPSTKKVKALTGTREEAREQFAFWREKAKEHLAAERAAEIKKTFAVKKLDEWHRKAGERVGKDLDTEVNNALDEFLAQQANAKVEKTEAVAVASPLPGPIFSEEKEVKKEQAKEEEVKKEE